MSILTGELSRRVAKYATEEECQQAKLMSYKKYASKKYYCNVCDKTISIYSYTDHINTKVHNKNEKNFLLYQNTTNK